MPIRKRGTGRWQVRVRPFPEMTVPTKEAAQTVELDLKLRLKLGHLYREKPTTLGQELDGVLQRKTTMGGKRGPLRPAGIRYYQDCVRPWAPLRDTPVPALRRRQVEDHIAARAAVAPTAARNELQFLKAALRAAQSRGQQVDVGIFEIEPIQVEPSEGVALEYSELLGLASWLPERIKRIVPFCGTVGLRFTEAVTLTDDRVDLEAGAILIPARINKSRRPKPIPLARIEVQILREQLLARPTGTRSVFPNEMGGTYSKSLRNRSWLIFALMFALAGCGGESASSRVTTTTRECHTLGSTSKPLVTTGPQTAVPLRKIAVFRRPRHIGDRVPRGLRDALNQLAGGGAITPQYAQSRRVGVVASPGMSVGAYLVPTAGRGLCFGFSARTLPPDCVRGFVGRTATWIVTASECKPSSNTFAAITTDNIRAVRLVTGRGQVRLPVANNVVLWRAQSQIATTDDLRRVVAITRTGSSIDVTG